MNRFVGRIVFGNFRWWPKIWNRGLSSAESAKVEPEVTETRDETPGVPMYDGPLPDLEEVKEELSNFGGQGNIVLELDDETGIGRLVIDNPGKKNALSGKMIVELSEAVDRLEDWAVGKAVLVRGSETGKGFCSGGDLSFVKETASPRMGLIMSTIMTDSLKRLGSLPVITAAYIHGSGALGGGAEIAAACDYRLMTRQAKIGFIHSRLGIVPAWGGVTYLSRILGHGKALKLVARGDVLNFDQATAIGLTDEVVNDAEEAMRWLSQVAGFKPEVVRASKASLLASGDTETQGRIFAALFGSKDNRAALERNLKHRE